MVSSPWADSRAQPKSSSRTAPRSSIRLSGLMSRWMSPAECIAPSAEKSGSIMCSSSPAGMRPPRCATSSLNVVPSTYSMTI